MKTIGLFEHINIFVDLSTEDEQKLSTPLESKYLDQGDYLLSKNQVCNSLYFVKSGCLRMYFHDKYSIEQIIQFAIEGWWITDYSGFLNNTPSNYHIQATEKTEVVALDRKNYGMLIQEIPQILLYFNKIMQINLAACQTKHKYQNSMTPDELLQLFCSSFPDFVERVPKNMIVSYLGILGHK